YLKESYGAQKLGRLMSFLFVWQLIFSAPLSIASGCLGIARYAEYVWPRLAHVLVERTVSLGIPGLGALEFRLFINGGTFVAMGSCLLALALLYRRISIIGQLARYLSVGVLGAILLVIVAGLSHFDAARAFSFPGDSFSGSAPPCCWRPMITGAITTLASWAARSASPNATFPGLFFIPS